MLGCLTLPDSLTESEKTVCKQKVIQYQLTQQQLDDVVRTYNDKAQHNAVKKPIGLFHYFIGCVKKGTLILPTAERPAEAPTAPLLAEIAKVTTIPSAPIARPRAQTMALPAIISTENQAICRHALAALNDEQIDKVFKTFALNEKKGTNLPRLRCFLGCRPPPI